MACMKHISLLFYYLRFPWHFSLPIFWSLYFQSVDKLERAQRKATETKEFKDKTLEEVKTYKHAFILEYYATTCIVF